MLTPEELRALGNRAFAARRYDHAVELYSQGLSMCSGKDVEGEAVVLLSNRCKAYFKPAVTSI